MNTPIGLQLYSVRDHLKRDFSGIISQIAGMGYVGVETDEFPEGVKPREAKKIFDDLGLVVISAHSPLPLGDDKNQVLDTLQAIGCPHLVSPWTDPDYYTSIEKIKILADIFNQAYSVAADNGMKFSIHNHDHEFALLDDKPAIYTLIKYLEPGIYFQPDTYWIQVAGFNPVEVVKEMGARAPLLHIKDYPATEGADMTAVGEGVIDVPAIVKAGKPHTEWWIVELDRCATDMLEAVDKSYQYLASIA